MSFNGWSWRAFVRPIGALSIGALVAACLVATPAAVAVKPAIAPKSAKTEAEASRLAAQFNTSVEVEDKLTEYTRTVATPQGTLKAEISNQPVRVRKGQSWVDIDTALETRSDGFVAPKASTTDVAFSNGGSGPLARFKQDGAVFELKSPWALPKPTLSGSKATYAAVLPGVDLVINATAESFSYNLVVQTREAASNPALRTLTFPVTTQNLELRTSQPGRPAYVDLSGRQVLTVGEALMWDSAGSKAKSKSNAAAAVDEGPSGEAKHALMDFAGSEAGLTVKPDQGMLAASDTVFPVVLDPTIIKNKDRVGWTAAWELYPGTSFWQTEHSLGVGYEGYEQSKIVRSYYQFNTSYYTNKKIIAASFKAYETHSASCTPKGVIVSRVKPISPRTTWNNQPAVEADVASKVDAKGWSSTCPAGFLEFDVTASMQATADADLLSTTFRLRATDEKDRTSWKQFDNISQLHVEYVAYPLPAYELGVASRSDWANDCAPSTRPTVVADKQPEISAKGKMGVGDPTARVYVEFLIRNSGGPVASMFSPLVSPDVLQTRASTAELAERTLYTYNARTVYPLPDGSKLFSAWGGPCFFTVDTFPPPKPTVTAFYNDVELPNCMGKPTCESLVPFGAKVKYRIESNSPDVVAFGYGFGGSEIRVTGQVRGTVRSAEVELTTPSPSEMKLNVWSHDAAEHPSEAAKHKINVSAGPPPVAAWSFDEGSGTTAADSSGKGHPLAVTSAQFDDVGRLGGSLVFNGQNPGDNRATTPGPVVDTSKSFSISTWVRLESKQDGVAVAINGTSAYGAVLRYVPGQDRWIFYQNTSATTTAAVRVDSKGPPVLNAWTHLLAVFNVADTSVTLYVNGRLQQSAKYNHTPWKAAGSVEVGSYRLGTATGVFDGSVDEVQIYDRVVPDSEAKQLADPRVGPSGHDETVAGLSASYPFDELVAGSGGGWKTRDMAYDADLTVAGFAGADQSSAVVEDVDRGNVLAFNGSAAESVTINRPVVDASGSFTVTAWVKITDPSKKQVVVRQAGTNKDSWRLEYRPDPASSDNAYWVFTRANGDLTTSTSVEGPARTDRGAVSSEWMAVAAVYDADKGNIKVRVNARPDLDSLKDFTSPFSTGSTQVGKAPADATYAPFGGLLDDLRVYAGVVSDNQLCVDVLGDPSSCPK